MHRHHRISDINDITGAELGRQLAENRQPAPSDSRRRAAGYPDLGQVTVRIRQRHAGLPCSSKSRKATIHGLGHRRQFSRVCRSAGRSSRPARSEGGSASRTGLPMTPERCCTTWADCGRTTVGEDEASPQIPSEPGPGYLTGPAGRVWRRHVPVNHPRRGAPTGSSDIHVPPGRNRVIGSGYHPRRQLSLDLLHQSAKLRFDARVLIQQIAKRPSTAYRLRHGSVRVPVRGYELLARVSAPVLSYPRIEGFPSGARACASKFQLGLWGRYSGHPADRQEDRFCRQRPIKPFLCLLVAIWADSNRSFHSCPPGHSQAAIFIEARSVADIVPGRMTSGSVKPQVASKTQVGTTGPK